MILQLQRPWALFAPLMRPLAALAGLFAAACGAAPPAPSGPAPETRTTDHFVFHYPAGDGAAVTTVAARLEGEYARVIADLGVAAMPQIRVTFYADHASLESATRASAGVIPPSASGLVTSDTAIHLMSPNAPGWGPVAQVAVDAVHELAHCVSLRINARIANNPRWFWESVAVYEAGQRVDLRTLSYMAAPTPPAFASLNTFDNGRVYELGYSIAEFVVARWGQPALAALIAANADTAAVLGLPLPDFEREWFAFVRDRYRL